jgi:hypothetical protein
MIVAARFVANVAATGTWFGKNFPNTLRLKSRSIGVGADDSIVCGSGGTSTANRIDGISVIRTLGIE